MSDDAANILDDLIARHGGRGSLSPSMLAVARQMAAVLASPAADAATLKSVLELERMLPTPPASETRAKVDVEFVNQEPLDLSRLSDAQLHQLDELLRAAGAKQVDVTDAPLQSANDALRRDVERLAADNAKLHDELTRLHDRNVVLATELESARNTAAAAAGEAGTDALPASPASLPRPKVEILPPLDVDEARRERVRQNRARAFEQHRATVQPNRYGFLGGGDGLRGPGDWQAGDLSRR